jgi:hypothetical protein
MAGFGETLAAGLDVNGDGYADVLVGAPTNGGPGRVHVYLGSAAGLVMTPAVSLNSPDGGRFGGAMAAAHDVNRDGYDDAIIGAPLATSSMGRAYLFFGGASGLAATPAATFPAPAGATGGNFGATVAGLGDVDGDSAAEFLIGAPFANDSTGLVFLYAGSPSRPPATTPVAMLSGPDGVQGSFGSSLASLVRPHFEAVRRSKRMSPPSWLESRM